MKYLLFIFALLFAPLAASAAALQVTSVPVDAGVGNQVEVTLTLMSQTPVNAFSGELDYDPRLLSVRSVSDGNSIVSLWISPPKDEGGKISFAGLTPGGYRGPSGTLFKVLFVTKAAGKPQFRLTPLTVLQNDGAGTAEPTTVAFGPLIIRGQSKGDFTEAADTAAPEPFTPLIAGESGASSVVFTAVDKGSGIDHYEVAEARISLFGISYTKATSPYLLRDQSLTSTIYVRAIDRAGNARLALVHRTHLLTPLEWFVCAIIIGVMFLILWRRR
jgi:hypothetical protein